MYSTIFCLLLNFLGNMYYLEVPDNLLANGIDIADVSLSDGSTISSSIDINSNEPIFTKINRIATVLTNNSAGKYFAYTDSVNRVYIIGIKPISVKSVRYKDGSRHDGLSLSNFGIYPDVIPLPPYTKKITIRLDGFSPNIGFTEVGIKNFIVRVNDAQHSSINSIINELSLRFSNAG